ncbi:MAG TPA: hypothetical protein VF989_05320 [Polyangiaceae bacterium]|jgi:hypothetical protein
MKTRASKPAPERRVLLAGWLLLAVSLPFGVTLEALHGFKVQAYLQSEMRRELWRLAHAHGTLLGILCLVFTALAGRHIGEAARGSIARQLVWGAVSMPLGFFLGGVLNTEGDPSLGIVLVPVGAALLLVALARSALESRGDKSG